MIITIRSLAVTRALFLAFTCAGCLHVSPGTLYESSTAPLTAYQSRLRDELRGDVEQISIDIGPRNAGRSLAKAREAERWLLAQLQEAGIEGGRDEVDLGGAVVANVVATFPGTRRPDEIILLGAHYDTEVGSPGANDNASGVALLLSTSRFLKHEPPERTVRIVFFVNEESPFTGGVQMGSRIHAERSRARGDDIVLMIAVDSIGYYSSEPKSQYYPGTVALLNGFPRTANFVAFLGNRKNKDLVDRVVHLFQSTSRFPSIGAATDRKALARSDHAPFWWQGYPALLLSDTSEARDPHYHLPTDTAGNIQYDELARFADGFLRTVRLLANADTALR